MNYEPPIEYCNSSTPTASVIWLHGLGADGSDFLPVVEMLNLPHIRFILPHAPYQKVTLNNGYEMRAWYDLFGLSLEATEDETGIRDTQINIEALIANENMRGIPTDRIVLAGFSQGGAIALHTALRHGQPLAGILALSTYLPLRSKLAQEKSPENQHTPIMMAHGRQDSVIPLTFCEVTRALLIAQGYTLDWHVYDMAHSVCMEEIDDIRTFLMQHLCN